jgi:hypothetical protein
MTEDKPLTISVPEAGKVYYGLSRNGSDAAAERGEIPVLRIGRLLRVPVADELRVNPNSKNSVLIVAVNLARVSWPSLASLNPQACRSMWECTRNVNFAATPALATMR